MSNYLLSMWYDIQVHVANSQNLSLKDIISLIENNQPEGYDSTTCMATCQS